MSDCPGMLQHHCPGCAENTQLRAHLARVTEDRDHWCALTGQAKQDVRNERKEVRTLRAHLAQTTALLRGIIDAAKDSCGLFHTDYLTRRNLIRDTERALADLDAKEEQP